VRSPWDGRHTGGVVSFFGSDPMNHALLLSAAIATAPVLAMGLSMPVAQSQTAVQDITGDRWSFALPESWVETNYPQPGLGTVSLVAQYESPDGAVFVNVVTEAFAGDAATYLNLNVQNMTSFGFVIHDQSAVSVGALPGTEVESTVPSEPTTRVLQRFALTDGTGYVLTCRTLESTFDDYREQCTEILDTFAVTP